MKFDNYYCITNSPETYKEIASILRGFGKFLFSWADEEGTMFDILLVTEPNTMTDNKKNFQGGLKENDLFVSIIRLGAWGFELDKRKKFYGSYIGEKLNVGGSTADKLAELLQGIIKYY